MFSQWIQNHEAAMDSDWITALYVGAPLTIALGLIAACWRYCKKIKKIRRDRRTAGNNAGDTVYTIDMSNVNSSGHSGGGGGDPGGGGGDSGVGGNCECGGGRCFFDAEGCCDILSSLLDLVEVIQSIMWFKLVSAQGILTYKGVIVLLKWEVLLATRLIAIPTPVWSLRKPSASFVLCPPLDITWYDLKGLHH